MDVLPLLHEIAADHLPSEKKIQLKRQLAAYLNELLLHDFASLIQLLYRVDVSEAKLKAVLKENPTQDAGDLMADLVIQRQQEKQAMRDRFHFPTDASEEERW